jgi:Family of unknown function (DUF6459)
VTAMLMESDRATRPALAVRVVPVPRSEPPTDQELDASGLDAPAMTALVLPLDLATGAQVQRGRRSRPSQGGDRKLRATGGAGRPAGPLGPAASRWGDGDPHPVNPSGRPGVQGHPGPSATAGPGAAQEDLTEAVDVRTAARRILGACVEVVGGYRPLAQLRPFCLPERFDAIVNRLLRPASRAMGRGQAATRSSVVAGHGLGSPGRTNPRSLADRVAVRRVQICELNDGAAEIAVVMARRDKVWAMAMRLERVGGRWLCCHLEVV